jgi:hypothetical protein
LQLLPLDAIRPACHVQRILLAAAWAIVVGRFQLEYCRPKPLHRRISACLPADEAARLDEACPSPRQQQDAVYVRV